jgi:O-antigen/teichoic acid export membrane protein
LRWIFAATAAYSSVLSCVLWLCAPALSWLFGHKYAGIEHMLHWLVISVPGMALRVATGSTLMALGKPWMRVSLEVAGLVALLTASIVMTARFGAMGMPLALACSEWTMAAIGALMTAIVARKASSLANRSPP